MKSRFIEIFARHRVAANLLMIIMIISGFWAVTHMNTQFLPNFDLNYITVTINWPGANAKDVERSVTIPTEEALRSVDNLKRMSSKSILGASIITMEFNAGTNMTEASNRVQQEINIISNLPKNSDPPIIKRLIPYESVAHLLITGGNNLAELRQLSYRFERQLLDRGIAKINIVGLPKKEVMIEIPTLKLAVLNMSLAEIAKRINQQSTNLPAGTIGKFEVGKELHSAGQARRLSEFARLPIVTNANGHMIRLGDIAKISERPRNSQVHVSYFGKPAVEMTLQRIRDSSALESARILQKWLAQTRHNLPAEIIIKPYYQSWKLIKERINLMLKNALFGLVLILFLLFLFLNIRIASWVAIGIPASFLAALALLYLFGGTINMVSLFAMIMTLGIIVDDSIVVGEEVLARMQAGKDSFIAIKSGVQTMFTPIMASSLTTIVTFSPLMLVGGIIGQTLFEIPLFVICIIIASLVECFLILPGHIYHSSKTSNYKPPIMQPYFNHFRDTYFRPMLWACLKNRWATICVAISLLIVTAGLLFGNHIKFNFFPSPEGTRIFADAQFIAGTPPSKVKQFLGTLEKSLAATNQELKAKNKNKNIVITNTSFQNRSSVSSKSLVNNGEQYASINVELTSPDSRKISNQAFIKAWRKNIKLPAGIENFTITQPRNGPPGRDIDIELSGNTLTQLKAAATKLKKNLTAIPGVDNVTDDLPFGKEHLIFRLTAQGHALGLTTTALGQQLRAAFQGAVAQVFYEPQDEVKVRVVLPPEERHHIGTLTRLPIITPKSKTVPLSSVASLENQRGFDELRHQNGKL
ncbi:MAG: efflux RND transporter permease subunit, partial [Gammaproteobacteria bacterium]|nr:efflux RND transporter permease subunit [Gammaproteobacteria bacterium]